MESDDEEDHRVLLKLRETYLDIMCEVNPEYEKYVIYENGVKVLYLHIIRATYIWMSSISITVV
jgi:hypothetical protein